MLQILIRLVQKGQGHRVKFIYLKNNKTIKGGIFSVFVKLMKLKRELQV